MLYCVAYLNNNINEKRSNSGITVHIMNARYRYINTKAANNSVVKLNNLL